MIPGKKTHRHGGIAYGAEGWLRSALCRGYVALLELCGTARLLPAPLWAQLYSDGYVT
jgi:hypothetical protein